MVHLVLVGTVHRDPEGHDKLLSILNEEDPDCLTVEMSPYAVRFRREKRFVLASRVCDILEDFAREAPASLCRDPLFHPAIRNVLALIGFPFEYLAVTAFSRSRDVPFHCIDRSDFSKEKLLRVERDLITRDNLRALARLSPSEVYREIEQEYSLASMAFGKGQIAAYPRQDNGEVVARDRYMAGKIRALLDGSRYRRLLHVGGWEHLIDHGKKDTLFTLLSNLRPQRRLLPRWRGILMK